eukprot:8046494-Lingulodinium_polyedra.AAC.1
MGAVCCRRRASSPAEPRPPPGAHDGATFASACLFAPTRLPADSRWRADGPVEQLGPSGSFGA